MSIWLKQSTAAEIVIGPLVDATDGVTAETGLTIAQADIRLKKGDGAFAQTNNAAGATHLEGGHYEIPLDATDTATLGRLRVAISESGALPAWQDFMVVPANVWDSMFGADKLEVDATQIEGGDATDAINAACDTALSDYDAATGTELAAVDDKIDIIGANVDSVLEDTGTTLPGLLGTIDTVVDAVKAVTDLLPDAGALTSIAQEATLGSPAGASVSADVAAVKTQTAAIEADTQDVQDRLPAALVSGRMDADVGAITGTGVITSSQFGAGAIDAAAMATDAVQEIRDAITGGAYALDTDANGRVRLVIGTAAGEVSLSGGIASADVKKINAVTLGGTGVLGDEWGPA